MANSNWASKNLPAPPQASPTANEWAYRSEVQPGQYVGSNADEIDKLIEECVEAEKAKQ